MKKHKSKHANTTDIGTKTPVTMATLSGAITRNAIKKIILIYRQLGIRKRKGQIIGCTEEETFESMTWAKIKFVEF
jgi:hypothetical protein